MTGAKRAGAGRGVQLLAFSAGNQRFVLDVMRVRELVRSMPLLPTPGAPPWVLGQMVLRAQVMPVLSLALCLSDAFAAPTPTPAADPGPDRAAQQGSRSGLAWAPHILVIDAAGHRFGLLVDRVIEVLQVASESLWPDRAPEGMRSPMILGLCEIRGLPHMMLDVRPLVRFGARHG